MIHFRCKDSGPREALPVTKIFLASRTLTLAAFVVTGLCCGRPALCGPSGPASFDSANPKVSPSGSPKQAAPTPAQAEVQRTLNDAIAVVEAGDLVKFVQFYAPVELLRNLRDQGRLETLRSSPPDSRILLSLLRRFQNGEVRLERDGLVARVTPRRDKSDSPPKEDVDAPDPLAVVPSPKLDKIKLVGYGSDLSQVLKSSLAALDTGELESFIDHVFPAGELGRLQAHGKPQLVARLNKQRELFEQMRRDLKALGDATPEFNADKTVATFVLRTPTADKRLGDAPPELRTVKFQKVAGSWRFYDNSTPVREEIARQSRLLPPKLKYSAGMRTENPDVLVMEKLGSSWRLAALPDPRPRP
jgi:hypothetical protein